MSDNSANLSLPYLAAGQAQPQLTHNEALRRLDAVVQLTLVSVTETTPPAAPEDGQCHGLPAGVTGAWAGQAGQIAVFEANAWVFVAPRAGWRAWVTDAGTMMVWDGSAWADATPVPTLQNLAHLGVQTTADDINRLAVASEASLLTHAGAGHQLKVNKAAAGDTASLLFQTGWSGRAEMGTAGSDDFAVKVSADGSAWQTGFVVDATTGQVDFPQGATGLAAVEFGTGGIATVDYVAARGADLVTNGTGYLGNNYNFPASFAFDPVITPALPGSFAFSGYYAGVVEMTEAVNVDPNKVYRLTSYLRQEGLPGDWSAFANGEMHRQYMGLQCLDADGLPISAQHHMRYFNGASDSLTTLAAPLTPGDTSISLTDASHWNDSNTAHYMRGVVIFGYRNATGYQYSHYSRHVQFDLFDNAGVDKTGHVITLNQPFPAGLGNPDDPSGTWPAGTPIANCTTGAGYKYAFYSGLIPAQADTWYKTLSHIGGIDLSGQNIQTNFPPGTASVRILWLPNFSNASGGSSGFPDTGSGHRVWFGGVSVTPEPLALMQADAAGGQTLKVPQGDFASGTISLVAPALSVTEV